MEKVLDVYKRSYNAIRPVVCMDESPKQLIGETRVPIPMSKGHDRKCDYEYERLGVCNIFLANEPLAGFRTVKITDRKCKVDWAEFIKEIADEHYPEAEVNVFKDFPILDDCFETVCKSEFEIELKHLKGPL